MRRTVLTLALFSSGLVLGALMHRQFTATQLQAVSDNVARLSNSWTQAELKPGDDSPASGQLRADAFGRAPPNDEPGANNCDSQCS